MITEREIRSKKGLAILTIAVMLIASTAVAYMLLDDSPTGLVYAANQQNTQDQSDETDNTDTNNQDNSEDQNGGDISSLWSGGGSSGQEAGDDQEEATFSPEVADLNSDSTVDLNDFAKFACDFGLNDDNPSWNDVKQSDFNGDGKVDLDDFEIFKQCFWHYHEP